MFLREPAAVALGNIRSHKLRSALMLLGIILSVSTLIVVIALISGINTYIAQRIANMGSNVFLVRQYGFITDIEEFARAVRRNRRITWEDYEYLRQNMRLAKDVGGPQPPDTQFSPQRSRRVFAQLLLLRGTSCPLW